MSEMNTKSHSFESALIAAGFGKFNYILIITSGLILGAALTDTTGINFILPIAQCELELRNLHKTILSSITYVGIILSSHLWGFLADTQGRKKVLVPTLVMAFVFTAMSSLAKSFWMMVAFRFLNGFCICASQSIIYAFVGEFHSAKNRARALLVASIIFSFSFLQVPIYGICIINQEWSLHIPLLDLVFRPWRLYLLACGFSCFLCAIVLIVYIPESPKYTFAQGDEARTLKILQRIFVQNTGKSPDEYVVKSIVKDEEFMGNSARNCGFLKFVWSQTAPLFKPPHLKNTATACFLQFSLLLSTNGFTTFYADILNKVSLWVESNPLHTSSTVCRILDEYQSHSKQNISDSETIACISKLEFDIFANTTVWVVVHIVGWSLVSLIINRVGKLVIIVCVLFSGCLCALLLASLEVPMVSMYLYTGMLCVGINLPVVNASTIELFPTSLRELGTYSWHTVGLLDPAGTLKSHTDICQSILDITPDQRKICMRSQRVLTAISLGAKIGREECQHHFRNSRWNCTSLSNVIYGDVLTIKSRETAYIHAINSAALAWSVTRACSKGDLAECSCDNSIRRKPRKWQWGGCSEDINYGVMFSRKFIDSQENNISISGLMNLHNNEAGRRAIRSRMQRVCKCHGMSGSCSVRVCWRRLPPIRSVGEALGQLYDGASYVKLVEREGKASKLRRRDPELKKLIKSDLVYLDESPDYCERQETFGILGTKGRLCNRTSHGIDGCRLLCCGRGYQTRIRHVEEKCKCRFVWCCHVKCELCNYRREEHICN